MSEGNEGLIKRFHDLSDKKLAKMLCEQAHKYTPEAVFIALREAEKRGGLQKLCEASGIGYNPPPEPVLPPKPKSPPRPVIADPPSQQPATTTSAANTRTLKEESIEQEWALMIENGAGNAQALYDSIQEYLKESKIPGGCTWEMVELQSSTWFSKVRRVFLIVNLEQFKDYHIYIGVRDYGIHLDCCYYITVEPGFLKQIASEKIYNNKRALSAPSNILVHQDLRAWATVVDRAVNQAADAIQIKLGQDPKSAHRGSKGFLDIW